MFPGWERWILNLNRPVAVLCVTEYVVSKLAPYHGVEVHWLRYVHWLARCNSDSPASDQHNVVIKGVNGYVIGEPLGFFRGAPGPACQAFDTVSQHGTGVVEAKERIKASALEFPLTHDTTPSTLMHLMTMAGKVRCHIGTIVRVHVGGDHRLRR